MIVRPRSLLLGLLVILYLQSCAVGQNSKSPGLCCFSFYTRPIPVADITEYEETRTDCPRAGVIFTTKKGRVCVDPDVYWVKPIPVALIREYEETRPDCTRDGFTRAGVIFTTKNGICVCVDPSFELVKRAMNIIDRRFVEVQCRESSKSPKYCCFSFYTRPIPVALIREYEETRPDCTRDGFTRAGVVFTTKNGICVCVDPSFELVKRAMNIIDRRFVEVLHSCLQGALVFIISLLFVEGQYYTVKACWLLCEALLRLIIISWS
ncbi:hypothetical protein MHYP_G00016140 [Metynnis hypsauchen]